MAIIDAMEKTQVAPEEIAQRVVDILSDRQAEDVVLLDIHEIAPFTDFFVIATTTRSRLMVSMLTDLRFTPALEGVADPNMSEFELAVLGFGRV